ncbi:hypothetical protein Asppvi_001004 [Aspergillus pseudoviridinutans]|uniref:Uncharacterized protein n=1 Tax=Aspergillus pseudoviridinutans TaxID=1517512 RepID=A0A9P3EPA0_9EURO|nr:uncharacterized protein Asppvi_001004 [Aspergillus pseudoviridinutans]GIJ82496.1 hypothetical protein Asppvi_001004 [Aspergillus pseudoviridinutans]
MDRRDPPEPNRGLDGETVHSADRAAHAEHRPADVSGRSHPADMARAERPQQRQAVDSPSRRWLTDRYHILSHTTSHSQRCGATACGPGLRVCAAPACRHGKPLGGGAPGTLAGPGICDIRMSWRPSSGNGLVQAPRQA